jgi:hypothetical protein
MLLTAIMFVVDRGLADVLKRGLDRYDGFDAKPEILCVGHSHTACGIDERHLAAGLGVPVAKYARHGAEIFERRIMIEDYFRRQQHVPSVVIYDVDPATFNRRKISENSYTRFFPYMDTPSVAEYLKTKCTDNTEFITRKYCELLRFNNPWLVRSSLKGHFGLRDSLYFGKINYAKAEITAQSWGKKENEFDRLNYDCLMDTIRFLRSKDVKVVLLYIPTLDLYNRYHEVDEEYLEETLSRLAAKDDGIRFLNYSKKYQSVHEYFIDFQHVNREGQLRVTDDLVKDLGPLLAVKRQSGRL